MPTPTCSPCPNLGVPRDLDSLSSLQPAAGGTSAAMAGSHAHHPVLPTLDAMKLERPPPALLSELLEEIFLRVASPADLARASAACVSFRRLISNPPFLRRYRSVHPPLLLGFLDKEGFHPVEATHPSAAVARAVARTADFCFDFLPAPRDWSLCDVRDGRVLVQRRDVHDMGTEYRLYWNLAVCDPLARRYLLLPPMTDDLLASVGLHNQDMRNSRASLVPSGSMEEETSFSVICWMVSKTRLVVFIFSTSSGQWAAGTSISWADLGLSEEVNGLDSGQCVYGCFYWKVKSRSKLLKLDMSTMELSKYDVPRDHDKRNVVVSESAEGKVVMFSLLDEGMSMEYYTFTQNGTDKSCKWHLKSIIPLAVRGSQFVMTGQAEGYIFLTHIIRERDTAYLETISLEVKSLNIERVCRTDDIGIFFAHPYFGFPPSMSPRRIQGYRED